MHFSRLLFSGLCLLLFSSAGTAQVPRVYRDSVEPHWFAQNTHFWYRAKTARDSAEFVLVDTRNGTRKPAFDHQKLAKVMAAAAERTIDPHRLPVSSLTFSDEMSSMTVTGKLGAWQISLATGEIHALAGKVVPSAATKFFLQPRKSVDRGGDVQLIVTNQLDTDVNMVWSDRDGKPVPYQTIKAGATLNQHTFVGHVWLLKSTSGQMLAAFEAVDSNDEIVIDEASLEAAKEERPSAPPQKRSRRSRSSTRKSPDGRRQAEVIDHNLWLTNSDSESEPAAADAAIQLTTDATADNSFQKDTARARLVEMRYILEDSPADQPDVRWSPDAKHLVAFQTTKVDERRVFYVESSPADQVQPQLKSYPYAKPGDPLPVSQPRLFRAEDGSEIAVSNALFPNPFKLTFLKWSGDGRHFYLLYNQRGHQVLRVLEVSTVDGTVRTIVDETSETFIHYSSAGKFVLEWLPNGELLWASESSGWNHLYRYNVADGNVINPVTSGDWNVRRIEHIDRKAGVIWFYAVGIAAGQDPYHEHFCRVNFDGTSLKVLTEGDGTHEITMSPDRRFFLDKYSRVDLPPITELRHSDDGSLAVLLEEGDASELIAARGPLPIRFTAAGRDGRTDVWGIIHLPRYFDPQETYPVVENIYAGPHDHHVPKAFRSRYRHQHQIADMGIVVVQIDGMGTAWRSKEFHDVCFQNLKDAGFPDRIAWMKAAAKKFTFLDISRVGIYGGSAGGQNAMAALLWHGTFYKAAVADCGCHDNRMDKLWWNEQWMGWPVDEHYIASSNTENAHLLHGKLMLVVGELDRNVDPASTTQVVSRLVKAGKDFTFLPVPGAGHGACETDYASQRRAVFLATHLRAHAGSPATAESSAAP